ncbi:N-ethylammeline chlorohydrolase, partial [Candidatus Micrarchaeota archaeon]
MEILVRNAMVLTQNGKRALLKDHDVLIEENKIAKVGKRLGEKAEYVIDGRGKVLMPGLVNTHTHLAMTLLRGYGDDMSLQKWLESKIWPMEAKLKASDVRAGSMLGCLEMIKGGTTSFVDMYFFMEEVARAVDESGMRANLAYGMLDLGKQEKRKEELRKSEEFVRKFNGKADGRISTSFGPHAIYTCSTELLQKTKELADEHGVR